MKKKYSQWKYSNTYIYMLVLKKNRIIIPKYKVIKLNIYIFNAFVVKNFNKKFNIWR